jgi:phenylalanine ammonia-lyase
VRPELVDALAALLNRGVTPVVPRYGSVGASGDLMPSAYIARVLVGAGEAEFQGRRLAAVEALEAAGLRPIRLAPKEGLALINGTTVMTAVASLVWIDAFRVLRALLGGVALSVEAMQSPDLPFEPWVHQRKGHPGQIAVAAYLRGMLEGSAYTQASGGQSCYSLRCAPQGLGQAWEALEDGRAVVEREINSANDNPLIDPETGRMYKAGNFYGGHIARLLDTWKIDFASMANWGNALVAVLVDDRFNQGLPANLTPEPGLNSGFKGMQMSVTSLACAVRQLAGPSSIHSLPTEQYNQDVVSLGCTRRSRPWTHWNACATRRPWCCWPRRRPWICAAGRPNWGAGRGRSTPPCANWRGSRIGTGPWSTRWRRYRRKSRRGRYNRKFGA